MQHALDRGIVEAKFVAMQGSSEECILVEVTNLSHDSVKIHVEPGALLKTADAQLQDILITRRMEIMVRQGATETSVLYGFCSEAGKKPAPENTAYGLSHHPNDKVQRLAYFLNENEFTPHAQQEAIWSLTNDFNLAGIIDVNPEKTMDLRHFCGGLMGKEIPWYSIDYGDLLNQPFESLAKSISGEMVFNIEEEGEGDLRIVDPQGDIIATIFENRKLRPAQYTQSFNLEAVQMLPGDYRFQLVMAGEVVCDSVITL